MKRVICLFLVLVLLVLTGCSGGEESRKASVFDSDLIKTEALGSCEHEYGEEASCIMFGEKLMVTILYPKTNIEKLDEMIEQWTADTVTLYQLETTSEDLKEPAELTVAYNSYITQNGIVSVEFTGIYSASYLAHPIDITETFNADSKTGKIIEIDDLLRDGKRSEIEKNIIDKFKIDAEFVDEDLLKYWVLNDKELKVILPQGEFLSMFEGTKQALFTKKELKKILKQEEYNEPEELTTKNQQTTEKQVLSESVKTDDTPDNIDETKPMIALTFDDGPSAHTNRLLDIFAKYGGKGTFFVLGNTLDNRKDTLKRIVNDGHEIGNHSWSHRQFTNLSKEEITDQIMMTRDKIYEITGYDCKIVRPPYGACNDTVKAVGKELGMTYVCWSVDTLDWKSKNADAVYKEVMDYVSDGAIILCHDLHKTTVDAMEKVIPDLIEKGYQLVTVSELLSRGSNEIAVGKVYYKN